jgi:hypothetical protein
MLVASSLLCFRPALFHQPTTMLHLHPAGGVRLSPEPPAIAEGNISRQSVQAPYGIDR